MNRRICSEVIAVCVSLSLLRGQSPVNPSKLAGSPPVQSKRDRTEQTPSQKSDQVPPLLQNYDFGEQLRVLQGPAADPAKALGPLLPGSQGDPSGKAPKGFLPRTDVSLNPTALEAVRMSETWRAGENTPAAGPDGRVLYAYGAGLPIVVCAPLRVCTIELQPGERVIGEPQIGDSVRWNIAPAMYGQGGQATSAI